MPNIEEIIAKCEALKREYERAIVEKENAWVKYERARDWCKQVAEQFLAAVDELDRAKENNEKAV